MINSDEQVEPVVDALSRLTRRTETTRTQYVADPPIPIPIGPGTWLFGEIIVMTVRRPEDSLTSPTVVEVMGHGQPAKADGTVDRRRSAYWTQLPAAVGEAIVGAYLSP